MTDTNIEEIEKLKITVNPDTDKSGRNTIKFDGGENFFLGNTGEVNYQVEEYSTELKTIYYCIEYIDRLLNKLKERERQLVECVAVIDSGANAIKALVAESEIPEEIEKLLEAYSDAETARILGMTDEQVLADSYLPSTEDITNG